MTHDAVNEYDLRKRKVNELRERGYDPYPSTSYRTIGITDFLFRFDDLLATKKAQTLAGRIRLKRKHGRVIFAHIEDVSGRIQIVFSEKDLGKERFEFVDRYLDVGDIFDVTGVAFLTKNGERSVLVQEVRVLTKAVQPLPDKWKGIQDEEVRYRKRAVDMLMHPELREMFRKKSIFWNSMRLFLMQEGFLEVETPVLETTPGGADAQPFTTHHNALGIDLYLRISMGELWQKRLMVAGFEKTFEIGRQFRNEGMSPEHLQDYTQMEFYWAYANYHDTMKLVERMYKHCIMETFGTLQFAIRGFQIDFDAEWKQIDYAATIQEKTSIDIMTATTEDIRVVCDRLHIVYEKNAPRSRLIDLLWKHCRKSIAGPVFLVNHPVEVSPLAKRSSKNPLVVERYQIIIAGSEQGNGYSELNDPLDQQERFEEQMRLREQGDTEAQMHDRDFVDALEVGMPPTSGFGVSERLFSFLMDKPIRECVLFPLLRPKPQQNVGQSQESMPVDSPDPSLGDFSAGITYAGAEVMMREHVKSEQLIRHNLAVGIIMQALGIHFGAACPENWRIAGVLHDVDYEEVPAEQHSLVGAEMLQKTGVHQLIVDAVREHNYFHGLEPRSILSKTMMSLEQLTGMITACAMVQPDKKLASVKCSSVKKKMKDKAFARGVDRTAVMRCEELAGLPLDRAIEICLSAMQEHANELGL